MASIRKRGNNWQVRIVQRGFIPVTKTFPSRELAELWGKKTEVDMARGAFIDTQLAEVTTLGDLFKRYSEEVSTLHRGQKSEVARLSLLQRDKVAILYMSNLKPQDIADLRDRRLKRIKESTCNRELQLVSAVINCACREWGIHLPRGNPCAMVRKPNPGPGRCRLFEGNEEALLYKAIHGDGYKRVPREKGNWWLEPIVTCIQLGNMDLTSPAGKMTMGVLAHVAQFERDLLIERTHSGLIRSKAKGIRSGRKATFAAQEQADILERIENGATIAGLAKEFGTTRQTIMRVRDKALAN